MGWSQAGFCCAAAIKTETLSKLGHGWEPRPLQVTPYRWEQPPEPLDLWALALENGGLVASYSPTDPPTSIRIMRRGRTHRMSAPTVTWLDPSFRVYDGIPGTTWNDVPGIYIFARLDADGWRAVYIGETNSLANRLPGHERGVEALLAGATHVHARVERDEQTRVASQDRLIETFQPELNDRGR